MFEPESSIGPPVVESTMVSAIRRYLVVLPTVGIHANRAVLFGSFARGDADQDSDIDLIVIAPEFDAERHLDIVKHLWETTLLADNRVEPIPGGIRYCGGDAGGIRPLAIGRQPYRLFCRQVRPGLI